MKQSESMLITDIHIETEHMVPLVLHFPGLSWFWEHVMLMRELLQYQDAMWQRNKEIQSLAESKVSLPKAGATF